MTNITFAELTALIAVNGLTVNDRYYITDKNWTIIAITTNSYRIVVPIVTEVTKAELDALVAANGLNEGLQYKVTDKGWLLLAITNNTYTIISQIPYKVWIGSVSLDGSFNLVINEIENTIGDITWSKLDVGQYAASSLGLFTSNKTFVNVGTKWVYRGQGYDSGYVENTNRVILVCLSTLGGDGIDSFDEFVEIRVYF